MDTFVRLFKGQQLNICALIDTASNRRSKIEKLVPDGQLEADQLIKLVDVLDVPAADIDRLILREALSAPGAGGRR